VWGGTAGTVADLAVKDMATMATIYQLSERLGQTTSSAADLAHSADRATGQSATIILFTGVRYERWADALPTGLVVDDQPWVQGPVSGQSSR
jgi:hypothetical protein